MQLEEARHLRSDGREARLRGARRFGRWPFEAIEEIFGAHLGLAAHEEQQLLGRERAQLHRQVEAMEGLVRKSLAKRLKPRPPTREKLVPAASHYSATDRLGVGRQLLVLGLGVEEVEREALERTHEQLAPALRQLEVEVDSTDAVEAARLKLQLSAEEWTQWEQRKAGLLEERQRMREQLKQRFEEFFDSRPQLSAR